MLITLYSARDILVGFGRPFVGPNDEAVKRDFKNFIKEQPNGKDFQLYKIGVMNDENGKIETEGYPIMVEFGGE